MNHNQPKSPWDDFKTVGEVRGEPERKASLAGTFWCCLVTTLFGAGLGLVTLFALIHRRHRVATYSQWWLDLSDATHFKIILFSIIAGAVAGLIGGLVFSYRYSKFKWKE